MQIEIGVKRHSSLWLAKLDDLPRQARDKQKENSTYVDCISFRFVFPTQDLKPPR